MLELLFPNLCPSCQSEPSRGSSLCSKCEDDIDLLEELSSCRVCGVPFGYFESRASPEKELSEESGDKHLCAKCIKGRYSFKSARSVAIYGGPVREMVHAFKYEGKLRLARVLADTMMEHFPYDTEGFDVVVPVPLYLGKLRQREYNQSAVLAAYVAGGTGAESDLGGLVKIRDTLPQIEIKDEEARRKNVRGAFKASDKSSFKKRRVLLVDDVFTTGSTSDECTKTLLNSGALSVEVLTLARARGI